MGGSFCINLWKLPPFFCYRVADRCRTIPVISEFLIFTQISKIHRRSQNGKGNLYPQGLQHSDEAYEDVVVTKDVYDTYCRTEWNIKDNNASFYDHEIQMSCLIGGEDNGYENFREFVQLKKIWD